METERGLLLKTTKPDGLAYNGFRWPAEVGAEIIAPDWNPDPGINCGQGLHGLLWGEGNADLLNWAPGALWRVLSADPADIVSSAGGGKVRCRAVRQEYVGDRLTATAMILAARPGALCVGATVTGGDDATVTGGDRATVTGGDRATVTGGDRAMVQLRWWDGQRYRITIAYVGEQNILAGQRYRLDALHQMVAV